MKGKLLISLLILSLIMFCGCEKEELSELDQSILTKYVEYKQGQQTENDMLYLETYIQTVYKEDIQKQNYWLDMIHKWHETDVVAKELNEAVNGVPTSVLQIKSDYKITKERNYTYLNGRVKNVGDRPIKYFEVTVDYMDEQGNVLDSDYTNSLQTLNVGDMKEFEIMHKYSEEYKKFYVYVTEVVFED